MTNADCIRGMNDEQLYDFLSEWECGDIDYSITFCDLCKQGGNELNLDCDGCRKHWLQRDAVEYGGLMYWKKNMTFDATADRKTEPTCDTCRHKGVEGCEQPCLGCGCCGLYEAMTETQTETQNSNLTFEKADEFEQFDREALILLIECQRERIAELLAKDEPQTDCSR